MELIPDSQPEGGFFKRLMHRFTNGCAPMNGDTTCPFNFAFDVHPGPMSQAIADAQVLHQSIFLFIYSLDNPATRSVVSLLQRRQVADEVRSFMFVALDVMCPEGWRAAAELEFQEMPLIALVRPRGNTLRESRIYVRFEGVFSESALISSMRIEMNARTPDAEIVREQDDAFDRVVREAQENERREEAAQEEAQRAAADIERGRTDVDSAYERLMQLEQSGNMATIRFQFPDNQTRTQKFDRSGPVRNLFVFARKFMYPTPFTLMTGFPKRVIEERDGSLEEQCSEKQFIVYVEEE